MSFPRYSKYKDSGVEWLGEVPRDWSVRRLKHVCSVSPSNVDKKTYEDEHAVKLCNYTDVYYNDTIGPEIDFMQATASDEQIARFELKAGDIIITKDSETADDIAISAFVPDDLAGVVCGYHLALIRPSQAIVGKYVKRLFDSRYLKGRFAVATNGLTRVGLSQYALDNVEIPVPPESEQTAIAAFLDRETGKIDALVAEQEKLIALLKEKRQAVISHAVTKGLNPDAPMKPSGIEWLGDVPAHWEVRTLRRVITHIEQGWSPDCFSRNAGDEEWGVLKAGCVNRGIFNEAENKALPPEHQPEERYEVRVGDVLMSRASGSPDLVGSTALVAATRPRLMLSDKVFRIHLGEAATVPYFVAMLNSRALRGQIEIALSGGNGLANNLPQSVLREFFMCIPPIPEQSDIANLIKRESSRIGQLVVEAERAIALLKERRAALISAAVTGQIDVREAA